MSAIFPRPPFAPAVLPDSMPVCEWIMPASAARRRDYFRICTALPAAMPDRLEVHVIHAKEGTERSTAALYGNHAYLIHYEFKVRLNG